MPPVKRYRLNEVHAILDMLESDPDYLQANLYIFPPADSTCSDEDSGDEDAVTSNNLTRRQLEAEAEATVWKGDKRIRLGFPDDNDFDDTVASIPRSNKDAANLKSSSTT
jgi:hypothetical protein